MSMESGPSMSAPQEESMEDMAKRHKEEDEKYRAEKQKSFLENAGPEWNEKELPRPNEEEWVYASDVGGGTPLYEDYGTYGVNNDKIAFCTKMKGAEGGVIYVAPFTPEKASELEELGYTKGGLGVPFSNTSMPFNIEMEWNKKFGKKES